MWSFRKIGGIVHCFWISASHFIEDVQVRGAELSLYTLTGRLAGFASLSRPGRRPAATAAFFLNFASVERNNGQTDRQTDG